ncbi:mitotic spindle checkpoint protein MAD2 [Senna tora]|uniref:Mitotic spindle checkpoint protein MAD2 n=1 Tax=Senna tora TaxID=362788 RepID=A0A834W9R6_9FABA|nr:mitotic spindle checkpoint protein MAD2 [Senna tora]
MAAKTVAKDIITLRGSAAIDTLRTGDKILLQNFVSSILCGYCDFEWEFFFFSILYNRGVYPEESFVKVKKYGLPMLLTQDEGVKTFIANLTAQLSQWLEAGKLQRVVLVIMSKATGEVLERWNFRIETDSEVVEKGVSREKSDKEIMREIQAIMRQIASSITYLPCLDETCVFDVLAYTDTDVAVPFTWVESDPKLIANPQMVKLHSFDTKIHKVDTLVSYKNDEWDEEQ